MSFDPGEQISDTCRRNPRLTPEYTPGEIRFAKYTRSILDESSDPVREATDALFHLWKFISNMQDICLPTTGGHSSNSSPTLSSPEPSTSSLRKPPCAESYSDDLPTSHPFSGFEVLTSPSPPEPSA